MRLNGTSHFRIALAALSLAACSGGPSTGDVEIGLTAWSDATPADDTVLRTLHKETDARKDLKQAVVTVNEIDLFVPGQGWLPIMAQPRTVDLLALDGQTLSSLGIAMLPVGKACKLRLVIADQGAYVVLKKDGSHHTLDVPDHGVVEVVGSIKLEPCAAGTVIVDFDPKITTDGKDDYDLRCRARIKTQKMHGSCGGSDGGGGGTPDMGGPGPDAGSCGGVVCAPGQICQGGMCVADPCAGVVCPPGLVCQNGVCGNPDPCAGVTCAPGETCDNGSCVQPPPPENNPDMGGGSCNKGGGCSGGHDGGSSCKK